MTDFNPGNGWRRVSRPEFEAADEHVLKQTYWDGTDLHCWVREEPVPLPTEVVEVVLSRLRATGRTTLGDAIREADLS